MIKYVIFDLDGTLIDTEKYFKVFWRQAAETFGYTMSEEQALSLRSLGRPFAPALMQEWFGEEFDYFAVRECRRKLMKEHLNKVGLELKPGAKEALLWLKENNYTVALATATPADRALEQLKEVGIDGFFTKIVSAAQVEQGKPAPDVYLYACKELGAVPKECLAVEDSPNGVMSAFTAGLKVLMVPDQTVPDTELSQKLYACVTTLQKLPEVLKGEGKMEQYFKPEESSFYVYGEDTEAILMTMAKRFIGENPPMPYQLRSFQDKQITFSDKGVAEFFFDRLLPKAKEGDFALACGDLWCPAPKKSNFRVACDSRTILYLNGECVFEGEGSTEKSLISVSLQKGFNRFIFLCRKESRGFCCTLQNAMPQWEPCCYVTPFAEWQGEAGFLYTLIEEKEITGVSIKELLKDPLLYQSSAEKTGRVWMPAVPQRVEEIGRGNGYVCVWSRVTVQETCEEVLSEKELFSAFLKQREQCPQIQTITVDGKANFGEVKKASSHQILWIAEQKAERGIPAELFRLKKGWVSALPVNAKGRCGCFFYMEGLDRQTAGQLAEWCPSADEYLSKAIQVSGGKNFWKTEYPEVSVRPYVESNLYGRFTYPLGVTLYGIHRTGRRYGNDELLQYVRRFILQVVSADAYAVYDKSRYGFPGIHQQLLWLDALDDCGSFGSCILEEYLSLSEEEKQSTSGEAMLQIADRIADYIMNKQVRREDGAFKRRENTMWIDDMYMSVPFLIRYAGVRPEAGTLEEACRQLLLYCNTFKLPLQKEDTYILSHMYSLQEAHPNGIPWSRGNGWVFFSLSEILMVLPQNHPQRKALEECFVSLAKGYLTLQDEEGLWHQILDEEETYAEASGTAMFVCAMARGIRYEIFPETMRADVKSAVRKAWRGLTKKTIDRYGNLYGVCQGSGWSYDRKYYEKLSWNFNDTHGIGIVMLAGAEAAMMEEACW